MLDPDLYQQQPAAAAKGGIGKGSSFSDGLLADFATILDMLHAAQALREGALPLALQAYCHLHTGCGLPLPKRPEDKVDEQGVGAVLEGMERSKQLELRCFLLQVCPLLHGLFLGAHSMRGAYGVRPM
jgi:hypothetical protein